MTAAHSHLRGALADKSAAQAFPTIASGKRSADVIWSQLTVVGSQALNALDVLTGKLDLNCTRLLKRY